MGYRKVYFSGSTELELNKTSMGDITFAITGDTNTPEDEVTFFLKLSKDDVIELIKDLQEMLPKTVKEILS